MSLRHFLALLCAVLAWLPLAAHAQSDDSDAGMSDEALPGLVVPPPAAASSEAPALAEYGARAQAERTRPAEIAPYGTGSRVNVPLEELPSTMTIVDDDALRERGAVNLEQALSSVTNVTPVWQYGGFLSLSMRGFQAITLYDGIRDSRAVFAESAPQGATFDIERIEVLSGPASVLYGYGAVGGVVNLVRRAPSRKAEYTLELGLGFPDEQLVHAGAQGPIGESFAYRVDLGRVTRTDFRGAFTERNQGTASVTFNPVRNHSFGVRVSYEADHFNTDVGIPTLEDPDEPGVWRLPEGSRYENRYNTNNDFLDYQRLELGADYRWDISSVTYLQVRGNVTHDYYDYLAAESLTYVDDDDELPAQVDREYLHFARAWTPIVGQVELHSEGDTGPVRHQFVFGYEIYNFNGKSDRGDTGDAVPGRIDFVYPEDDAAPTHRLQKTSYDEYRHITNSVYGFDHMHLLQNLILTGGLRFDHVSSRVQRDFIDRETGEPSTDPMTGKPRPPTHASPSALTGQVGLVYTPWRPFTAYVGYASAFKPLFVSPSSTEATDYKPERANQIEGGVRVRSEMSGHELSLDGAVYYIQKLNMLIPRGPDDYEQAGEVQSIGFELAARYRAPRFVSIDVSYALTQAKFIEFISTDAVSGDNIDYAGKHPEFTPVHSAQAWLRFAFTEEVGVGVGGRLAADQYGDTQNRVPLPDYALLDASAWIRGERISFVLSARNLLDEHAYFTSSINGWALNPQVTPGPGREILGTLRLTL